MPSNYMCVEVSEFYGWSRNFNKIIIKIMNK